MSGHAEVRVSGRRIVVEVSYPDPASGRRDGMEADLPLDRARAFVDQMMDCIAIAGAADVLAKRAELEAKRTRLDALRSEVRALEHELDGATP